MWQLKSTNIKFYQRLLAAPSIMLSTVELPRVHQIMRPNERYETLLMTTDDSDVLGRHETLEEAISFHRKKEEELHLVPAA